MEESAARSIGHCVPKAGHCVPKAEPEGPTSANRMVACLHMGTGSSCCCRLGLGVG